LGEPALDRALYQRSLAFILADPLRFLLLSLDRVSGYFWLLPSAKSSLLSNLGRVLSFTIFLLFMLYGLWRSRHHWRAGWRSTPCGQNHNLQLATRNSSWISSFHHSHLCRPRRTPGGSAPARSPIWR